MPGFLFATGIENSYPTIAGGARVDEMEKCGHYRRWREDLALVKELGLSHLRWGPALHRTFTGPGRYDWAWSDEVLHEMDRLVIEPILDLLHFGLPDWLGNFQNRDFPEFFAEYAGAFARRHRHVRHWTPVNEAYITAMFSARYGWWNECLTSEAGFVRATLNLARAGVLATEAIRDQVPDAVFVQSESFEYFHPAAPAAAPVADFENERRFLPLDLVYGRGVSPSMYQYLRLHGMNEAEYAFFRERGGTAGCLLGADYYVTNEHLVKPDGSSGPSGDVLGFYAIARQYYDRYRVPLMHTETNRREEEDAAGWLRKQWQAALQLRRDGVPLLGFTWFSLTDQMDWDTALREDARRVNSVGLYDLDRKLRPVGKLYRQLVREWSVALAADEREAAPRLRLAA
jgi:beta-glucosidase/6-phospho-beta-glucosidase/beta-galactosidase